MKLDKYLNESIGRYISTASYSKYARKMIDDLVDMIENGEDLTKTIKMLDKTLDKIHDDAYGNGFNNGYETGHNDGYDAGTFSE